MTASEKEALFRSTQIVFPFLSVPKEFSGSDLAVDFFHGRRLSRDDQCLCGSGLPYRTCHGRIPGLDELLSGDI